MGAKKSEAELRLITREGKNDGRTPMPSKPDRTVYIVRGEDDDDQRVVCGVFSGTPTGKEAADRYCADRNGAENKWELFSYYEVEEHALDENDGKVRKHRFEAMINLSTGDVTDLASTGWDIVRASARVEDGHRNSRNEYMGRVTRGPTILDERGAYLCQGPDTFANVVSYVSQEHARELARKARQLWLDKQAAIQAARERHERESGASNAD